MKALDADKPVVCRICKGETPRRVHDFNEGVTPGRCAAPKCNSKQKIKKGSDFLICTACTKHFHKQKACSELFPLAMQKLDRTSWICPLCTEEDEIEETTDAGDTSTQYATTKGEEMKLKILQLNVDCITSKMEELKGFLKKYEIDVFLFQETKLIKRDKKTNSLATPSNGGTGNNL